MEKEEGASVLLVYGTVWYGIKWFVFAFKSWQRIFFRSKSAIYPDVYLYQLISVDILETWFKIKDVLGLDVQRIY